MPAVKFINPGNVIGQVGGGLQISFGMENTDLAQAIETWTNRGNVSDAEAENAVRPIFDAMLKKMAFRARNTMSGFLRPGNQRYDVGHTGAASENLEVVPFTDAGGQGWGVQEGAKTQANRFIRSGSRGGGKDARGMPNLTRLALWLRKKGYIPQVDSKRGYKARWTKGKAKGKGGGIPRPYADVMPRNEWETALFSLANHIRAYGTSSQHEALYPQGRPYFDYITYYARMFAKGDAEELMQGRNIEFIMSFLMNYLRTGRPRGGVEGDLNIQSREF